MSSTEEGPARPKEPHPITTTSTRRPERLVYTVNEAAQVLAVGRSTIYELIHAGDLQSFTIGSRRLIARVDIESYIDSRRAAAAGVTI